VQKWKPKSLSLDDPWQEVKHFQTDQYPLACEYAATLSGRNESVIACAVFEDGAQIPLRPENCAPASADVHSAQPTV
jgi:hypothetical protein